MRLWQQGMISLARNEAMKNFMQSRAAMSELARRFVGGQNIAEAAETSRLLKSQGYLTSLFYLGEYVEDLDTIHQTVMALRNIAQGLGSTGLDMFICVDPTQIGYHRDSLLCRQYAFELAQQLKRLIEATAPPVGAHWLMLDMEDSTVTQPTLSLYADLHRAVLPVAVTLQAYLYRTESDLKGLIAGGGVVRLVKGAFAEGRGIAYTRRTEIDHNYLQLARLMLSEEARQSGFYPIFATHDNELINRIIQLAHRQGWPRSSYEFEMLYGVRPDLQKKVSQSGEKVRLYLPFGVDWWPYAVRRVGESYKNVHFLWRSLLNV